MISKKSRKQLRKEQRKQKKVRKNNFFANKNRNNFVNSSVQQTATVDNKQKPKKSFKKLKIYDVSEHVKQEKLSEDVGRSLKKEKREQNKLEKQMKKQRAELLKRANLEEDRNIKQLEKQLKLNKRKSKAVPKSFVDDGLDYLLEVCDSENLTGIVAAEQQFMEADEDFEEDFTLMSGNKLKNKSKRKTEDTADHISDYISSEEDDFFVREKKTSKKLKKSIENIDNDSPDKNKEEELSEDLNEEELNEDLDEDGDQFTSDSDSNSEIESKLYKGKNKNELKEKYNFLDNHSSKEEKSENCEYNSNDESEEENYENIEEQESKEEKGVWEDIYGRLRRKDGSILQNNERKYIPPAVRAQLETEAIGGKNQEKLNRLKRELKGLINRLAEANMHKIAVNIEQLYMANSRNDMNQTLTNLIFEALLSPVLTPERFVIEHTMLITILHANVGVEVGAHFLQCLVKKFDEVYDTDEPSDNKTLENIIQTLSHLYNFRVFDANLLYEILDKLNARFTERDIECILLALKSVGFSLRKDNPLSLKNLIVNIQKQAANNVEKSKDDPRVKFMLDILMAIKNNNMTKIPSYDPTYAEHLKKLLKNFVRKGLYVSSLNISLEDLLKADERGKWWIVGSAWTGKETGSAANNQQKIQSNLFSQKLLDLARKQRMNTDTRRNIFCILMSAEDYLDAFEKLLHLDLKNQQEREIIHVIVHCCLQEKSYNPYYAYLTQKFCDYDRRFQMIIKYSIWDKLKTLPECSGAQLSNMAKLLTHLFLEKGLPISTLKIVQFSELDKITLRFIRQILLGILLSENVEQCLQVFEKVSQGEKLKLFRESISLFIKHFLLRNLNANNISDDQKNLLEERANLVDKMLSQHDKKVRF